MDYETFVKAVCSLSDFPRNIGIMGGEPTIHPQFERFILYLQERKFIPHLMKTTRKPIVDYPLYTRDKNYFYSHSLNKYKGWGLFSSLCEGFYVHYELIQDIFTYQIVNDHKNNTLHQPLLVSRKDLGVPDSEWFPLRDKCWLQNTWCATITPKGAFFCEVAGALDMLFDGPGGWPIESGWWKRTPDEFGDQLNWCELCGAALFQCGRLASDEIDDITESVYEKLLKLGSPKINAKKYNLINENYKGNEMPQTSDRYLSNYSQRLSKSSNTILPKYIDVIVIGEQWSGDLLNKEIKSTNNDWILLLTQECRVNHDTVERLKKVIVNPGVLYTFELNGMQKTAFFNCRAYSLRKAGFDGIAHTKTRDSFFDLWEASKRIKLNDLFDRKLNPDIDEWISYVAENGIVDKQISFCLNKIVSDYNDIT
jgi:hypothetical protein